MQKRVTAGWRSPSFTISSQYLNPDCFSGDGTTIPFHHPSEDDGATLKPALEQMERLTGSRAETASVDRGLRGKEHHPEGVEVLVSGRRGLDAPLKKLLRRRAAIEPVIGHVKAEHGLERNYLKGKAGDRINAMLSGCGFNLRKLLRESHRLPALWRLLCRRLCILTASPWQTPVTLKQSPANLKQAFLRDDQVIAV